jgi:hypothetical protein
MQHLQPPNIVNLPYFRAFRESSVRARRQEFAQQLQSVGLVFDSHSRQSFETFFLIAGMRSTVRPPPGTHPASPLTPAFPRVRLYAMFVTCPSGMSISPFPVSEHIPVFSTNCLNRSGSQAEQSWFAHEPPRE